MLIGRSFNIAGKFFGIPFYRQSALSCQTKGVYGARGIEHRVEPCIVDVVNISLCCAPSLAPSSNETSV